MSWSKFCRIFNFVLVWMFGVCNIVVVTLVIMNGWDGIFKELFWPALCGYWFAKAYWEEGTVKRIDGKIKDTTLSDWAR